MGGVLPLIALSAVGRVQAEDGPVLYETHVRPIFRSHCFDCHGATDELKGDLDLRLVRYLLRGGKKGPAIVPGDAGESLLLRRVREGEMPPGDLRVPPDELRLLERWIEEGARTARPEPESIGPGLGITPEEREFWSLEPIGFPTPPTPAVADVRGAIDSFLAHAMPDGTGFSLPADRRTLAIRLYLDVIGLPPSPDELASFLGDNTPASYERLVDRALSSPHFGERWARHWLDVAGYADSEGYSTADAPRRWTYRYRDYVIRSFNEDKPLDRFLLEQLAGDELAGPKEGDWTGEQIELLTATGFLRLAADGTGSGANDPAGRNQVVADTLKILGSSLLGLSIGCAQCHDHRYDPISQRDYYSLRAVFEPALDPESWRTPQARAVSLSTSADREAAARIEEEATKIAAERAEKQKQYIAAALDQELSKYEEPLRQELRAAFETPSGERSEEQSSLLAKYPSVNIHPGVLYQYNQSAADDLKKYDARIAEVRARKPVEEFIRALIEPPGHAPPTRLFHRGDHRQPRGEVPPGVPAVLVPPDDAASLSPDDPALPTTGRRLAFARWLSSESNPLTARVLANRVWLHLFGRGLVETPADLGRLGAPPTHPELLDWLASTLRRDGWSLKRLVRRIVLSAAYRQSSAPSSGQDARDPDNRFYSRQSVRRLDAEILRDRLLAASGSLDRTLYGPPVPVAEDDSGQVVVAGRAGRRSLYVTARRSQPVGFLQVFDTPVMETNCERRASSTTAPQSLMLLNGAFVLERAAGLAARARLEAARHAAAGVAPRHPILDGDEPLSNSASELDPSPDSSSPAGLQVEAAWRFAYQREARDEELELAAAFLRRQLEEMRAFPRALPDGRTPLTQAFVNLCHVLLISNEFLHVE